MIGPSHTDHFCYLGEVDVGYREYATCWLHHNAGRWVIRARLRQGGDAEVACVARCYNN
jgi:hypothetical protein